MITVRAGAREGSYLRVDEQFPDVSVNPTPTRQAAWFGGSRPTIEQDYVIELIVHNFELDNNCTDLVRRASRTPRTGAFDSAGVLNRSTTRCN